MLEIKAANNQLTHDLIQILYSDPAVDSSEQFVMAHRQVPGTGGDLSVLSQVDFEAAAQSVMMETLRDLKRLRPKALWGVSPYPSCYNGDPGQTMLANYTGQCPAAEMGLNDELVWLWRRCSALYPVLTLEKLQVGDADLTGWCQCLSYRGKGSFSVQKQVRVQ